MPKTYRMTKDGKLIEGIFQGDTINTPSMLCVEDYIDALKRAEEIGGLPALIRRADANVAVLARGIEKSGWAAFLAASPRARSNTSVCLKITDAWFTGLKKEEQAAAAAKVASVIEKEGVAFDIGGYRAAPPGLRIWCGATVDSADVEALVPWLDWAFAQVKQG